METQNITISIPKIVLQKAQEIAYRRGISVSQLLSDTLETMTADNDNYEKAKERALKLLGQGIVVGTNGQITWTRDEMHERKL